MSLNSEGMTVVIVIEDTHFVQGWCQEAVRSSFIFKLPIENFASCHVIKSHSICIEPSLQSLFSFTLQRKQAWTPLSKSRTREDRHLPLSEIRLLRINSGWYLFDYHGQTISCPFRDCTFVSWWKCSVWVVPMAPTVLFNEGEISNHNSVWGEKGGCRGGKGIVSCLQS